MNGTIQEQLLSPVVQSDGTDQLINILYGTTTLTCLVLYLHVETVAAVSAVVLGTEAWYDK